MSNKRGDLQEESQGLVKDQEDNVDQDTVNLVNNVHN